MKRKDKSKVNQKGTSCSSIGPHSSRFSPILFLNGSSIWSFKLIRQTTCLTRLLNRAHPPIMWNLTLKSKTVLLMNLH